MNSLVQIAQDLTTLEQKLIESEGHVTPEIEELLVVNSEMLPAKVDNYSLFLNRCKSVEQFYLERADFFYKVAKQMSNVQDQLNHNIKIAMQTLGVDELTGQDVRFKLQGVKAKVVIDDDSLIPKDYKKEVIKFEIEKERLRGDLEIGAVPGAHLEKSFALKTYAATPKKGKKDE